MMLKGVGPLGADSAVLSSVGEAPPVAVTLAAILQILLAATFLIMPLLVLRHGSHAQAAAEAEVARQGFPAEVLAKNGVHFDEGTAGLVLPVAIALGLGALAALNVVGNEIGRILTWILQPMLLVGGGLIIFRQVAAARFVESSFERSGDPILAAIDVRAFVDAATEAFPRWFVFVVRARFVLVTLGSALVIVLLALPSAGEYFS
jgi:hypothetical protein